MVAYTYQTLATQIAAELDRPDLLNSGEVDYFLEQARQQIVREAIPFGFEAYGTGTFVAGTQQIPLPSDYRDILSLQYTRSGTKVPVDMRQWEYLNDYWPNTSATGNPAFYAHRGSTLLVVAPTPGTNYTWELAYYAIPGTLGTAATSNWLTENAPDLVLNCATMWGAIFVQNKVQVDTWSKAYQRALASFQAQRGDREATERPQQKLGIPGAGGA